MENIRKTVSFHKLIRRVLMLSAIIPILIFGFYMYYNLTTHYENDTQVLVKSTFDEFSNSIDSFNQSNKSILQLFIKNDAVASSQNPQVTKAQIMEVINSYESLFPEAGSIALGLRDGRMFTRYNDSLPKDFDPRVRPWYTGAIKSASPVFISDPYVNAVDNKTYNITYSAPVYDKRTNEVIGVAGMDVDLSNIVDFANRMSLPEGSYVALADKDGNILVDSKNNIQDAQEQVMMVMEKYKGNDLNGMTHTVNSQKYNVFMKKNPSTGWNMFALIPQRELANRQKLIIVTLTGVILLLVLLSIFSSRYFDRLLLEPIDHIVSQLGDIDLETDIAPISRCSRATDEIGIMYKSINDMLSRIREQRQALMDKQAEISTQYEEIEALYGETTAMNDSLNEMVASLNDSYKQTIRVLSNAIEANDQYTRGHCARVTEYSLVLAEHLKFDHERISQLELAALLHDVGKVGIPNNILNKTEALTDEEFVLIRKHPQIGYNIISDVPFLKQVSSFVLNHHEYYNGNGYPNKLKGEGIPLEARILSVADAYDAMTTARSYRKRPLSVSEAFEELKKNSGTQFDPDIVTAFEELLIEGKLQLHNDNTTYTI